MKDNNIKGSFFKKLSLFHLFSPNFFFHFLVWDIIGRSCILHQNGAGEDSGAGLFLSFFFFLFSFSFFFFLFSFFFFFFFFFFLFSFNVSLFFFQGLGGGLLHVHQEFSKMRRRSVCVQEEQFGSRQNLEMRFKPKS